MIFLRLLFLLLLFSAPGLAMGLNLNPRVGGKLIAAERLYLIMLPGFALVGWTSLLLAEWERFSLPAVAILVLGGSLLAGIWGWRRQGLTFFHGWRWTQTTVWLLLFLSITLLLSPQPYEYIVGGRDHGVYVNTGIHIARSGGIIVYDQLLPIVPAELRSLLIRPETRIWEAGFPGPWSMGQHVTGLTIRDLAAGSNIPHAFHLYPALIAVFAAAGGIQFALATTPALALLGFSGFFLVIRRLFGNGPAVPAAGLLLLSVTQIWFTRYPAAEVVIQLFFWGGLFCALLMLEIETPLLAALAGLCFGLLHLAKLDTVHMPLFIALFFGYLWLRGRYRSVYHWFWLSYVLLIVHTALHAIWISTIYFLDHLIRSILPRFLAEPLAAAIGRATYPAQILRNVWIQLWPELLAGAGFLLLAIILLIRFREQLRAGLGRINWGYLRLRLGLTILLLSYSTAVTSSILSDATPTWLTSAVWSGKLTLLYISAPGMLLALAGTIWLIQHADSVQRGFFLWLIAGSLLPIYLLGAGTAPDHFWVIRRYFPIAFPFFIAAISYFVGQLWLATRERAQMWRYPWLPLLILLFLGWRFWQDSAPVLPVVDYAGLPAQLADLSAAVPENAILFMQRGSAAARLDYPLWVTFGKQVYMIEDTALADQQLATAARALAGSGRPIYWLLPPEQTPPNWPDGQLSAAYTFFIDTELMESSLDFIPRTVYPFQIQLTAYALTFTDG